MGRRHGPREGRAVAPARVQAGAPRRGRRTRGPGRRLARAAPALRRRLPRGVRNLRRGRPEEAAGVQDGRGPGGPGVGRPLDAGDDGHGLPDPRARHPSHGEAGPPRRLGRQERPRSYLAGHVSGPDRLLRTQAMGILRRAVPQGHIRVPLRVGQGSPPQVRGGERGRRALVRALARAERPAWPQRGPLRLPRGRLRGGTEAARAGRPRRVAAPRPGPVRRAGARRPHEPGDSRRRLRGGPLARDAAELRPRDNRFRTRRARRRRVRRLRGSRDPGRGGRGGWRPGRHELPDPQLPRLPVGRRRGGVDEPGRRAGLAVWRVLRLHAPTRPGCAGTETGWR